MASENILVRLAMNASDYVSGANKAARATNEITGAAAKTESGARRLAAQYGSLAKAAAGVFVARAAVNFGRDSVRAFSDLEESINAVNVSFGAGAGAIKDFGTTAAEQVGLSNAAFNQMSVTTGALLSNFIDDEKAVAAETIKLTKRAADMASVFNTSVPDALNAVQAAIRGEMEPARRFGVMLDDMTIRSHAVEMGLAATTGEVDRQAKGIAALDLIYEQTNKTAGDFAATADSLANKQKSLAAAFEDTKAQVGEALAPAFDTLLNLAAEMLPVLENLAPAIGSVVVGFSGLLDIAGPLIGALGGIIDKLGVGLALITGSDIARHSLEIRRAQEHIDTALRDGGDTAVAYANALAELGRNGRLAAGDVEALAASVEFLGDQQAVATSLAIDAAREELASLEARFDASGKMIQTREDEKRSAGDLREQEAELRNELDRVTASVGVLEAAFLTQISTMDLTAVQAQDLINKYGLEATVVDGVVVANENLIQAYIDSDHPRRQAKRGSDELAGSQGDVADATDEATGALQEQQRTLDEMANPALRMINANRRLTAAQEALTAAQEGGVDTAGDVEGAMLNLITAWGDAEAAEAGLIGKSEEAFTAFFKMAVQAGLTKTEITQMAAAWGLTPAQVATLYKVHTSYTSSGSAPEKVFTGTQTRTAIPAYAEGGDFSANQAIMVGELGPEILVPSMAGSIIPNSQVGGGGVTNIYMEGRGDVYDDVSLALAMSGITEAIEWSGTSTLR